MFFGNSLTTEVFTTVTKNANVYAGRMRKMSSLIVMILGSFLFLVMTPKLSAALFTSSGSMNSLEVAIWAIGAVSCTFAGLIKFGVIII